MGTVRDRNYPLDLISLAPDADRPMHRQLCDQLRDLILNGAVPAKPIPHVDWWLAETLFSIPAWEAT